MDEPASSLEGSEGAGAGAGGAGAAAVQRREVDFVMCCGHFLGRDEDIFEYIERNSTANATSGSGTNGTPSSATNSSKGKGGKGGAGSPAAPLRACIQCTPSPPGWQGLICPRYNITGGCPYGANCWWDHVALPNTPAPPAPLNVSAVANTVQGTAQDCWAWAMTGSCRLGDACPRASSHTAQKKGPITWAAGSGAGP